jgi:hypothetical protein
VRHAGDLTFRDVRIAYESENVKSPFVFFDAHGVTMDGIHVPKPATAEPIRLHRVTNFQLKNAPGLADVTYGEIDMPMPISRRRQIMFVSVAATSVALLVLVLRWLTARRRALAPVSN